MFDVLKKLPITAGREKAVMVIQMLTTLMHVALNYLFVIKFDWSVRGTAYAMDITQLVSVIALIFYVIS